MRTLMRVLLVIALLPVAAIADELEFCGT